MEQGAIMKRLQMVLATAILTTALLPVTALAADGPAAHYDLATRQTDTDAGGEYDGRLRFTIATDGSIGGSYMDTEGDISTVAGGLTGTKIWLDMHAASAGTSGIYTGTFSDGKLVATHQHGLHTLTLQGSPAAH
jgi:hypothetical protein